MMPLGYMLKNKNLPKAYGNTVNASGGNLYLRITLSSDRG